MAAGSPPEVRKGLLTVPTAPGLGLEINPDFLKKNLVAGEPFWS
jgi:L-alanine-DL-glutamate epimerase-like enolase superfamily enzyme